MSVFDTFVKKHDYLVCVDSDGCAMDTSIAGVDTLCQWVEATKALSNDALAAAIEAAPVGDGRTCLEKALSWSKAVNASIAALPEELKAPYPGAKDGLAAAHTFADVAVVSSANRDAVDEEWTNYKLLDHVDIVLAQDCGSKAYCIAEMLKFGYTPDHVLMVGDAPGDCDAAEKNGVYYFPILVNKEEDSWTELKETALAKLQDMTYGGQYQDSKKEEFLANLVG